jgi:hypothetical protein
MGLGVEGLGLYPFWFMYDQIYIRVENFRKIFNKYHDH